MYFWNLKKVEHLLAEKKLSDADMFPYLLVTTFLYTLVLFPISWEVNKWDIIGHLITIIISLYGIYYIYTKNGWRDSKHFLDRYIVLSWVVGIRWILVFFLPIFIVYLIIVQFTIWIPDTTLWQDITLYNLLYILFFYLLGQSMERVNSSSK